MREKCTELNKKRKKNTKKMKKTIELNKSDGIY